MMREIKFRAWDKHDKEFAQNIYCLSDMSIAERAFVVDDEGGEFIVEQYTGLKDKNGKEIYEGDILREKGLLSSTCVEWDKNNARYITKVLDRSKCVASVFYFDIIDALECEVIGNIHDNPELIGEEK